MTFDGGEGTALDVDEEGRLVVQGAEAVSYTHLDVYKRQGTDIHIVTTTAVAILNINGNGFSRYR